MLRLNKLIEILSNDRQWPRLCEKSGNTRKVKLHDQLKPIAQFMLNRNPKGCVKKFKTVAKPKRFAATMNKMVDLEKFAGDCKLFHKLDGNTFLAILPDVYIERSLPTNFFPQSSQIYTLPMG